MRRKKQRNIERELCIESLSRLLDMDSASRLQVYDHIFEQLLRNMAGDEQDNETVFEIGAQLREVAVKYAL